MATKVLAQIYRRWRGRERIRAGGCWITDFVFEISHGGFGSSEEVGLEQEASSPQRNNHWAGLLAGRIGAGMERLATRLAAGPLVIGLTCLA